MNTLKYAPFLAFLTAFLIVGCTTNSSTPTTAKHQQTQIGNANARLQMIGALSSGVDSSLDAKDIPAAKSLNDKVQQIADKPTPEEVALVKDSITNDKKAEELNKKIESLIIEKRNIENASNIIITAQETRINQLAQEKKQIQEALDDLSDPVNAIWYGVKTIIKRIAWTLTGIGIVFLLLRLFANSNPVAGAIFDVLQRGVAYVIKSIGAFFPRAIEWGSNAFQTKDETLEVLIDAIQSMNKTQTIAELKEQLDKDCDTQHKLEISNIKRKLGWK